MLNSKIEMNTACIDVKIFGQPTVIDTGRSNPYALLTKVIAKIRKFNRHRKWMEYEAGATI